MRGEWRDVAAKPEEIVRQTFISHLIDHYGYSLAQMDQERRTQHGHKSPRADIVIWEALEKKANNNTPVLVVECKSEGVDINVKDYYQGESYTRAVGCEFFIAHNTRFTAVFKLVPGLPGDFVQINEIARASDWGDAKRIEEIKNKLLVFNRKEFPVSCSTCHHASIVAVLAASTMTAWNTNTSSRARPASGRRSPGKRMRCGHGWRRSAPTSDTSTPRSASSIPTTTSPASAPSARVGRTRRVPAR